VVDLTAAGTGSGAAPFGAGAHACPGEQEAIALAEGVVAALVPRCRAVGGDVVYLGGEVLRIPARYEMCEVR